MLQHAHRRLHSAIGTPPIVAGALLLAASGCSGGPGGGEEAEAAQPWSSTEVNAVSRPIAGAGVAAVTGLRPDGRLETSVYDLAEGKRLWAQPATMAGRLSGMGVQPPAVTGALGGGLVTALEPRKPGNQSGKTSGNWNATLVARDSRTGTEKWTRPVHSTFGPVECGPSVCLSEFTATEKARFVALDPATGKARWQTPGVAEVQHADGSKVVLFRMSDRPALEARDLRTGRTLWNFPVERAVGTGVNLSGGWAFGALDAENAQNGMLIGYLAPYQARKGGPMSPYGFFGVRLSDGKQVWARKRLLRVYPSANPAVALVARAIPTSGYGGFERLDPRTGRTTGKLGADKAPKSVWWMSFPDDLGELGFVTQGKPGAAYDLRSGAKVTDKALRTWSFCTMKPSELKITGLRGFYPVAPLCAYEVATGKKAASPGTPPAWYTGVSDGWRVWRDERGALHGVKDTKGNGSDIKGSGTRGNGTKGNIPGMYGT
ncbi:PQQ-binding-like beta-propeller repeat protein [Actinomadura sp. 9N407]|uniref:outer membrane protein assembly factor BamB family protein n=1 Tax=Actinomadura sp. 9N407 TaxID=3375154 RepID=UPI0037AB71BE